MAAGAAGGPIQPVRWWLLSWHNEGAADSLCFRGHAPWTGWLAGWLAGSRDLDERAGQARAGQKGANGQRACRGRGQDGGREGGNAVEQDRRRSGSEVDVLLLLLLPLLLLLLRFFVFSASFVSFVSFAAKKPSSGHVMELLKAESWSWSWSWSWSAGEVEGEVGEVGEDVVIGGKEGSGGDAGTGYGLAPRDCATYGGRLAGDINK